MRTYFMIAVLCFSSLFAVSQKLELEKASPFTAVKWEEEQALVQFEEAWYHFEKLDNFTEKEILDFCKSKFGDKWQKRFSEDLVEVLQGLDYQPNIEVALQLSKDGVSKTYTGRFTFENRQSSLAYNRSSAASASDAKLPQNISIAAALADIKEFEEILSKTSSYSQLSNFDYKSALRELSVAIVSAKTDIDIDEFANELGKILAEIGDRHSSIKNEAFNKINHAIYNLKLPFAVTSIEGQIVALKQDSEDENYTYYYQSHPRIKSIDGIAVQTLVDTYNYRAKKAPQQAKLSSGSKALQNYGALLFNNNLKFSDSVRVVFSDAKTDISETFQLTTTSKGYTSKLLQQHARLTEEMKNENFVGLSKVLADNIGYINIPRMNHYTELEGLEDFIENTLKSFSDTKALIIDVRNNPGGGRAILQTFADYLVQAAQSPWVANVAYLRTDSTILGDEASMSGRYLYSYDSDNFTENDRTAIDKFNRSFKLQKTFDTSKFSSPFYMVLHNGKESYTKPVYILVNEYSFSAASVFTSAFKGLPNVKIVGETTDGSSGNSRLLYLKNSNIRVRISTMLSFQRNGKTLDGNGTEPDIHIPADEAQVLEAVDNQLNKLIEMINHPKP